MTVPLWVSRYIGIPYEDHGDTLRNVSCIGLVKLVLRERCGIEFSDYGDLPSVDLAAVAKAFRENAFVDPWTKVYKRTQVQEPIPPLNIYDLVLMHSRRGFIEGGKRIVTHIGIMVTPSEILHVEKGIDSVVRPLVHKTIHPRIFAIVRHKSLEARNDHQAA